MFRRNLGQPWYPTFFSICGTFVTAITLMLIIRPEAPAMESIRSTQWWNWIGGPLGALIVLAGAALNHQLGSAAFIALVVGGQLVCSVLLDHFALMGLAETPITLGRVIGVILVVSGVICIKYW
jgi:transporter family-2 protein